MLMQIIFFAAIAGFVLIKLYNVLGKTTGAPPQKPVRPGAAKPASSKPALPTPLRVAFTGPAAAGLEAIRGADSRFDPKGFLKGAKIAYENVVGAYSRGDKKTLKSLLQTDVYTRYVQAIEARENSDQSLDTEVIRIKKAEIIEAELKNRQARVVVEFSAEISTRETNAETPDEPLVQQSLTTEEWTFVRDARSRDPNWKLASVATLA